MSRRPGRKKFGYRDLFRIIDRRIEIRQDESNSYAYVICPWCEMPIRSFHIKDIELDHDDSIGFGEGRDTPDNCAFMHGPCHKEKSRRDKARMDKADRAGGRRGSQYARRKRKGSQIKSRGFDKRYRRKMDGTVERREN